MRALYARRWPDASIKNAGPGNTADVALRKRGRIRNQGYWQGDSGVSCVRYIITGGMIIETLPGGDLIREGLDDLAEGRDPWPRS